MVKSTSGLAVAVSWIVALVLETALALWTFKTRLAADGTSAARALSHASIWEALHLFCLAFIIPGWLIFIAYRYVRQVPLSSWSLGRPCVLWITIAMVFYCAMMVETAVAETILPVPLGIVVRLANAVCISAAAMAFALTSIWLWRQRRPV